MTILGVAYFLAAKLGMLLMFHDGSRQLPSPVWPAAGVALAGLVLFGRRAWPGVAIGGFLAGVHTAGMRVAAGIAVGQTVAAVVGATLLRARSFDKSLVRLRDVLRLIVLGAGVTSLLSAAVGTAVLVAVNHVPSLVTSGIWWVGDATGIILVAPLLLVWGSPVPLRDDRLRRRNAEAAAVLVLTAGTTFLLFHSRIPLIFLVFPFFLWAGKRLGLPGAAMVNVVLAGVAIVTTRAHHGPFGLLPASQGLVILQAFDATVAVASLVLAVVSDECHRALDEVRVSRDRILDAGDRVQDRVRRDLHDGLAPTLGATVLQLQAAQELVRTDPGAAEELIERLQVQTRGVIEDIRRLVAGLGPLGLDTLGLVQAVRQRALHFARPPGRAFSGTLQVRVQTAGDLDALPPPVELAAYHIVSEALNNASRHGKAKSCVVSLSIWRRTLVVEVIDDGR
ncbi:MAG TPA: MASE1 domain-containing protein, partial [Actinomycetota bacterium]